MSNSSHYVALWYWYRIFKMEAVCVHVEMHLKDHGTVYNTIAAV